jgi:hypothetical protein
MADYLPGQGEERKNFPSEKSKPATHLQKPDQTNGTPARMAVTYCILSFFIVFIFLIQATGWENRVFNLALNSNKPPESLASVFSVYSKYRRGAALATPRPSMVNQP